MSKRGVSLPVNDIYRRSSDLYRDYHSSRSSPDSPRRRDLGGTTTFLVPGTPARGFRETGKYTGESPTPPLSLRLQYLFRGDYSTRCLHGLRGSPPILSPVSCGSLLPSGPVSRLSSDASVGPSV